MSRPGHPGRAHNLNLHVRAARQSLGPNSNCCERKKHPFLTIFLTTTDPGIGVSIRNFPDAPVTVQGQRSGLRLSKTKAVQGSAGLLFPDRLSPDRPAGSPGGPLGIMGWPPGYDLPRGRGGEFRPRRYPMQYRQAGESGSASGCVRSARFKSPGIARRLTLRRYWAAKLYDLRWRIYGPGPGGRQDARPEHRRGDCQRLKAGSWR